MGERSSRWHEPVIPSGGVTPPCSAAPGVVHAPSRDPVLEVRLLGGFEARWCGAPIAGLASSRRTRSLVQHLLVARGAAVARDELAFELWPDVADGQARANLRQALRRAGRLLPQEHGFVVATITTVAWNVDAPAVVDLLRFDACLRGAAEARSHGDREGRLRALREAASLYRGDLGLDVSGGRMERARASLHEEALWVLRELVELHLADGRTTEAIAACERVLALDPLDEPTYVRLMRLYETVGAPRKGLHVYERLRAVLHGEVASAPSAASEAVAARLGERVRPDDRALAGPSDHQLARLRSAVHRSRSDGAQLLVLSGDVGRALGPAHLAADGSVSAPPSAVIVRARAHGEEARVPFSTAARLLGPMRLALAAERVGAPWSTELRRLSGGPAHTLPPTRSGADAEQIDLVFAALSSTLRLERDAVRIVLEAAEHIDPASARWLGWLLHRRGPGPLVVVGVSDAPSGGRGPLERLIDQARALHRCIELDIGRSLDVSDERLVAARLRDLTDSARLALEALAVLGTEAPPETIRRVVGRPRDAVAASLEELARLGFVASSGDTRSVGLRSTVTRDAVLAGMPPGARALLHGRAADVLRSGPRGLTRHDAVVADHLERAGRLPEAAAAWLEAARRAASVSAHDVAIDAYERAIALAGTAVFGTASPVLVDLWRELGDVYALRFDGERARHAFAEATRHANGDPVTLAALAHRRAETHVSERAYGEALAELDLAAAALRSAPRRSRSAWRTAIDVDALRARTLYLQPDAVDAVGSTPRMLLERLERAVARHGTLAQRYEADQAVLRFQIRDERYRLSPATRARAERAVRTAVATGDALIIADARFGVAFAELFGGDPDAAIAPLEEVRLLAERCGARLLLVQSVAYLGVACRLARRTEALDVAQRALETLVGASTALYTGLAHAQRAHLDAVAGDARSARRRVEAALEAWADRWYPFRWTALCTVLTVAPSDEAARDAAVAMLAPDQHRPPPGLERALERFAHARTALGVRRSEAVAAAHAAGWI
jgi:DNA-binding SARP family transcriptional activator